MTYRGHVEGGVIVLDSAKKSIPEGTIVKIEPLRKSTEKRRARGLKALLRFAGSVKGLSSKRKPADSPTRRLLRHAGKVSGLPRDLAKNHDHYLHGHPKK